jgi:hypothetical protein
MRPGSTTVAPNASGPIDTEKDHKPRGDELMATGVDGMDTNNSGGLDATGVAQGQLHVRPLTSAGK